MKSTDLKEAIEQTLEVIKGKLKYELYTASDDETE